MFMSLPPSPSTKIPLPSDAPELAVPWMPMTLLRTRAFNVPVVEVATYAVERTCIAEPFDPRSVWLRRSAVITPTSPMTRRLPPAAAPGFALAPRLSNVLPRAAVLPPTTASIDEFELFAALTQSARTPFTNDDWSVQFRVVPAFWA